MKESFESSSEYTKNIRRDMNASTEKVLKLRQASIETMADAMDIIAARNHSLFKDNLKLKHDIEAYRGALGYPVSGDHAGKLSNGETPKCGMCNSNSDNWTPSLIDRLNEFARENASEFSEIRTGEEASRMIKEIHGRYNSMKTTANNGTNTCSFCNWTNSGCLNIAGVDQEPKWICHGCIKRGLEQYGLYASIMCSAHSKTIEPDNEGFNFDKLIVLLCDVAQAIDGWHNDGTPWTEWDKSLRQQITEAQTIFRHKPGQWEEYKAKQ